MTGSKPLPWRARPHGRPLDGPYPADLPQRPEAVYYLSLEFLIGRLLYDSLSNLGWIAREALTELGVDLERIRLLEPDAALGNGGLGRLAACFMESMSTLGIAAHGYGIRYEHGCSARPWSMAAAGADRTLAGFRQPLGVRAAEVMYPISFGGSVETVTDETGKSNRSGARRNVRAIAYDTPVVGWRGASVNTCAVACAGHGRSAPGTFQRR
jgi:starch phosphorylase